MMLNLAAPLQLANVLKAAESLCYIEVYQPMNQSSDAGWIESATLKNPFKAGLLLAPDSPEVIISRILKF